MATFIILEISKDPAEHFPRFLLPWSFAVHWCSLLTPSSSFSPRLLPNCIPSPQRKLFCSPILLSQLLHLCPLPHVGHKMLPRHSAATKANEKDWSRWPEKHQCLLAPSVLKTESTETPTALSLGCRWPREAHSLLFFLMEPQDLLTAVQVVGWVSLPVRRSGWLQSITHSKYPHSS